MPAHSSASDQGFLDLAAWLPRKRALLWMLLAFAAGLLLFALVWLAGREDVATSPVEGAPAAAADVEYNPLPAPLPARNRDASGLRTARERPAEPEQPLPQLVEAPPPPPLAPVAVAPQAPPPGPATTPEPLPERSAPPRYPPRALRRGESGTVTVRADIDPGGVPVSVSVEHTSGSRELDRAALEAVRRWRFRPAMRDGQPTSGSVVVPISFNPGG